MTRLSRLFILSSSVIALQLAALAAASAQSSTTAAMDPSQSAPASPQVPSMQRVELTLPPARELWAAAEEAPPANALAPEGNASSSTQETSGCHWTLEDSNDWHCNIQPLPRHDLEVRKTLHFLWPLHRKKTGQ